MSDDFLMTAWWLPGDCLMIAWWLLDDCSMTVRWLPDDCSMTVRWLPKDCLMIAWWLPKDFLMIAEWVSDDSLMVVQWLSDDCLMTVDCLMIKSLFFQKSLTMMVIFSTDLLFLIFTAFSFYWEVFYLNCFMHHHSVIVKFQKAFYFSRHLSHLNQYGICCSSFLLWNSIYPHQILTYPKGPIKVYVHPIRTNLDLKLKFHL